MPIQQPPVESQDPGAPAELHPPRATPSRPAPEPYADPCARYEPTARAKTPDPTSHATRTPDDEPRHAQRAGAARCHRAGARHCSTTDAEAEAEPTRAGSTRVPSGSCKARRELGAASPRAHQDDPSACSARRRRREAPDIGRARRRWEPSLLRELRETDLHGSDYLSRRIAIKLAMSGRSAIALLRH
jgi:hypothetical protein